MRVPDAEFCQPVDTSGRPPKVGRAGGPIDRRRRGSAPGLPDALLRLRTGTTRKGFESGAVRHDHADEEAAVTAIPQRVVIDLHFLAGLDRSATPLVPAEPARAHAFEAPLLILAGLARHLHPEEGVRLRPFELVHG